MTLVKAKMKHHYTYKGSNSTTSKA